jgi:hypothetical protein
MAPVQSNVDGPKGSSPLQLKKRFSWEEDSDEEDRIMPQVLPKIDETDLSPQTKGTATQYEISPEVEATKTRQQTVHRSDAAGLLEKGDIPGVLEQNSQIETTPANPAYVSVSNRDVSPIASHEDLSQTTADGIQASRVTPPPAESEAAGDSPVIEQSQLPPKEPRLAGFREIMSMKTPDQRISTFNNTREQFASMETGLHNWLKQAPVDRPEHATLIEQNGQRPPSLNPPHKPSPSRTKFPKLGSLGNLTHQTSSHQDNSANASSSGPAKHANVMHGAGVLGKAGGAAKGLFAKGRSKFRNSASSDKVDT